MGKLITNIEEFGKYYPTMEEVDWDRIDPSLRDEEMLVLRRVVLGPSLFDQLATALKNEELTDAQKELLELCRQFLGPKTIYRAWRTLSVLVTSSGVKTTGHGEGSSYKDAPMWMSEGAKDDALRMAYDRLDALINHLVENETTFSEWAAAPLRQQVRGSFVTTLGTVEPYTSVVGNAWVLHHLRPSMRHIQTKLVRAHMPAEQYTALLAKVHSTSSPTFTETEQEQLDLIREAMVYGALATDLEAMSLKMDHRGYFTLEGSDRHKTRREAPANRDQVNSSVAAWKERMNAALTNLRMISQSSDDDGPRYGAVGGAFVS